MGGPKDPEVWSEIVGVVGNVKTFGPTSPTQPQVYESLEQAPDKSLTMILRTKGKAPGIAVAACDIIHAVDPNIEIKTLYDFEGTISYAWRRHQLVIVMFSIFSGMALLLAAVGIYGVMAYSVGQRTQEIGIRMALGALPSDVLRLVLTGGAKVVGMGLLVGLAGAVASSRLLAFLLFNLSPYDPLTFGAIVVLLSGVAFFACWIPARRATKVNPLVALRHE
jgi:ABC-type antimicrobial peptide transport system permease subunit